jgi:hypothetical protein
MSNSTHWWRQTLPSSIVWDPENIFIPSFCVDSPTVTNLRQLVPCLSPLVSGHLVMVEILKSWLLLNHPGWSAWRWNSN